MNDKMIHKVGWFASIMTMSMYGSYIDQIRLNLLGQKGSKILAIITIINCSTWLLYGFSKEKTDFPMVTCNGLGVVLAIITFITEVF